LAIVDELQTDTWISAETRMQSPGQARRRCRRRHALIWSLPIGGGQERARG
jgi:hypothetical protein